MNLNGEKNYDKELKKIREKNKENIQSFSFRKPKIEKNVSFANDISFSMARNNSFDDTLNDSFTTA